MRESRRDATRFSLRPEKVAYWYFRLNGFFQIENFVVHPEQRGAQRTDADLLAVRFPYRAEFLIDHPNHPMDDDAEALSLSGELIDVVVAEVKTNAPCTLNGPWTLEDERNVNRVLAAIGCIPSEHIANVAADIYREGIHNYGAGCRVRLVAIGRDRNQELTVRYPEVTQVTWADLLEFIWNRFRTYRRQKTQVDQWDAQGRRLKALADRSRNLAGFLDSALGQMGVRHHDT